MASLAGQQIKDKYIALLKTADNGDLSANSGASAVNITDGIGTGTALSLSTDRVGIGNSSPAAQLTISAITGTLGGIRITDAGDSDNTRGTMRLDGSGNGVIELRDTSEVEKVQIYAAGVSYFNGGNFGIGTASPGVLLDVEGSSTHGVVRIGRSDDGNGSENMGVLTFGNDEDSSQAAIYAVQDGGIESAKLQFKTQEGGNTLYTRMTIDKDGKVGIGTDSPDHLLHLSGTGTSVINLERTSLTSTGVLGNILFENSAGTDMAHIKVVGDGSNTRGNIEFGVGYDGAAATKMILQSDGNVGIGTATPDALLEVEAQTASGTGGGAELFLSNDDGAAMGSGHRMGTIAFRAPEAAESDTDLRDGQKRVGAKIECFTDAAWSASENGADLVISTNDGNNDLSEAMRVTADGSVGIGTTVPNAKLTVEGTMSMKEQSDDATHVAGYSQIWVDDAGAGTLMFTDDAGTKYTVDVTAV